VSLYLLLGGGLSFFVLVSIRKRCFGKTQWRRKDVIHQPFATLAC